MEKKKNRKREYLPSFIFLIFVGAIFVLFLILPKKDYSEQEKRVLSQFPDVTVETVFNGNFGKDFETYLADQMPLRSFFVGADSYSELLLGKNGINGIYKCQDDYLINTPISSNENLNKNIMYIHEFAEDIDVPVYMTVVPSTGYIMEDVLPTLHYEYNDKNILNNISSQLTTLNSKVQYVDLCDSFFRLADDGVQLYYKTDHHWTAEGAFSAYNTLCNAMNISSTPKENFNIEKYEGFFGTTYSKSALWLSKPDTVELWKNKNHMDKQFKVEIIDGGKSTVSNNLFFENHLSEQDKYPVYLDGNHSFVRITNTASDTDKKLLVIKDSFAHCLIPYMADNYSEIIMIDMRYYKDIVSEIVQSENIDTVLVLYGLDNIVNDKNLRALM